MKYAQQHFQAPLKEEKYNRKVNIETIKTESYKSLIFAQILILKKKKTSVEMPLSCVIPPD